MIKIKNLSISYGEQSILKNVSFDLPRFGMICICGESGSGKSSLLNAMSCLIPFEGSIEIDGIQIGQLTETEGAHFRLKNIGFVFQDFKLFENQTVEENVGFPFKTLSNCSLNAFKRVVNDTLQFCEISHVRNRTCFFLSGGEKQRVALARGLVNNPKILICDEPTGSLDENTSHQIMKIIKAYSKKALVVMVTHDKEIANKYADRILTINNKRISIREVNDGKDSESVAFTHKKKTLKKPKLPFSFAFNHAKQNMKNKKTRTIISNCFMSLGLLGIGVALAFTDSISNDLKRSYASLAQASMISIEKEPNSSVNYEVMSFEDTKALVEKYNDEIIVDYGIGYRANFEEFFKDSNALYIYTNNEGLYLDDFSIRDFNDFEWIKDIKDDVFPFKKDELDNDEIVLGLTINQIRKICSVFNIDLTVKSLSNFFLENNIFLTVELENFDWQYWDQQVFSVVGFTLSTRPYIAHTNQLFNEVMFEENMRFPTNKDVALNAFPWVLEKITYIKTNDKYDFIKLLRNHDELDWCCFEVCDISFFSNKFEDMSPDEIQYLIPYYDTKERFTKRELDYIQGSDENIFKPVLYNYGGYVNYPTSLISGFSHRCYFSFNEDDINETIENNSSVELNKNEEEILKRGVICSDFSKTYDTRVLFSSDYAQLLRGREPSSLHEIIVSTGLYNGINFSDSDFLYLAVTTEEINRDKGINKREYEVITLKIVGVVENDDFVIYHDTFWTEDFFSLVIGMNVYETAIRSISFSVKDEESIENSLYKLKRAFPQYEIINPLSSINESINSLCSSISVFIFFVSIFSLVISLILLCSCSYLHIQDIRKEIALARCIGINSKDSLTFLNAFMIFSLGTSLLTSFFELLITSGIISYFSSKTLLISFKFSITIFPFIAMSLSAFVIGLISIVFTSKHIRKIKPIDCLKF